MGDGTAANVIVGVVGGIFRGPLGSTLPTDVTGSAESTLLANGYAKAGYASTDGVVQSMGTSSNNVTAWGGDTVRTVQTEHTLTYAFTPIEHSAAALQIYYGDAATTTAVQINGNQLPNGTWVIPVRDGNKRIVIVIPNGQVTDRGDVTYSGADAASLPVTVTAYPDANGVKAYLYIGDIVIGAPTITVRNPTTGGVAGGNVVTLTGTNFINVLEVRFGTTKALAQQAQSPTSLLAIAPAHAAGAVNITVLTQQGVSIPDASAVYTYA